VARPQKEGLDYFPHDVYAASDPKLEPIIMLYGSKGYGFYFLHLEYIYRNSGMEFDISDAETREVICQKLKITNEEYDHILQTCLKKKCFDKEYYEKTGKLTSNGVKKRAAVVTKKRENMKEYYEKLNEKKRDKTRVSEDSKKISSPISAAETTEETEPETDKSKGKESKVKESKVEVVKEEPLLPKSISDIKKFYEENNFGLFAGYELQKVNSYIDDGIQEEVILLALEEAKKNNVPTLNYAEKILNRCFISKIFTADQFKEDQKKRELRKQKGRDSPQGNCVAQHHNHKQREYPEEFFEGLYEEI
jgi:DnaD/phage-associated family protein